MYLHMYMCTNHITHTSHIYTYNYVHAHEPTCTAICTRVLGGAITCTSTTTHGPVYIAEAG